MHYKTLEKALNHKWIDYVACLLSVLFVLGAMALNLNRYWQFNSGHYDLGIFDSAIWNVAHFRPPIIDHLVLSGKHIWADHFHPSIFLFSPIYWFTDKTESILIAQNILVGLSGLVIYLIGVKLIKERFVALSVLIAYFLFTGLQNAVLFDFHDVTAATLFIALTYWAVFQDRKKLFFIFLIITLGFKESMFAFGIGISVFIYLTKREWRKIALFTGMFSLLYGVFVIKYFIPFFSGGLYQYGFGKVSGLTELLSRFYTPIIKVKTLFLTELSFIFLPLLAPQLLIVIILHYAPRFLNSFGERWDLGLHYNAEIAPTLAVSAILGFILLKRYFSKEVIHALAFTLIATSFVLFRFVLHGPYGLALNPVWYQDTMKFSFLSDMVKAVPADTSLSVMAQNNLLVRFSHHRNIRLLRTDYKTYKPDYILFDLRSGQNPNNYLGLTESQFRQIYETVKVDSSYNMVYGKGDQYVFKRK